MTFNLRAEWLGDAYVNFRRKSIPGNSSCKSVIKQFRKGGRLLESGMSPAWGRNSKKARRLERRGRECYKGSEVKQEPGHAGAEDGGKPLGGFKPGAVWSDLQFVKVTRYWVGNGLKGQNGYMETCLEATAESQARDNGALETKMF